MNIHNGLFLRIAPQTAEAICRAIATEIEKLTAMHKPPIVLVSPQIRPALKQLTGTHLPQLVVLSYNEITRDTRIEAAAMATA